MIHLNGKKFAENEKEFVNSIFESDGTCVGFARRYKKSVSLFDHQKNKIAVINNHGVLCCATKRKDGRYWYSLATVNLIGRWESYRKEVEECAAALRGAC